MQPFYWTIALLLLDYSILVLAFKRFDLLTLVVGIFTFGFLWGNYSIFVFQQQVGASAPMTAFVVWGVFLALAGAIAFQSTLRRVHQRMAVEID